MAALRMGETEPVSSPTSAPNNISTGTPATVKAEASPPQSHKMPPPASSALISGRRPTHEWQCQRRPPAPSLGEQPELCYLASCIYKQRRHDDAAVGANDAHEDHHYTKRGRSRVRSEKSDAGAHGESPSWSSSERHARKHPRAEQTCKDGAERRQPERWRSAKQAGAAPRPGHLESRRSRSPLSVTRRAQRKPGDVAGIWAAHCPARPYRVRRTRHRAPRKRSAQCSRAPTASSSGMLAMATPPTTPDQCDGRARTDRRRPPPTHAPMMVAMTLLAAVAPARPRSLYETGRTMEARGRHRVADPEKVAANSVASGLYRRSLIPLRRAAPSPQRGTLRYPSRGRRVRR